MFLKSKLVAALIAVLWLTVLLTVIASGFAFSMRGEALAARNALSFAQARAIADGAIERTAFELQRPRNLADVWTADGEPHKWQEGDTALTTTAVDESAKIDINTASDVLFKGLLQHVGGMDAFARGLKIATAIRQDGRLAGFVKQRYASWDSGIGAKIESGKSSFKDLEAYMLKKGEAAPNTSGRQEFLENLINEFI